MPRAIVRAGITAENKTDLNHYLPRADHENLHSVRSLVNRVETRKMLSI